MIYFKRLARLVNMIKRFKIILISVLLLASEAFAISPDIEKEIYIGCYGNSKIYIGPDKAKEYCLCTINKLSEKYSEEKMDLIFKKEPEEIIKATKFAATYCENK